MLAPASLLRFWDDLVDVEFVLKNFRLFCSAPHIMKQNSFDNFQYYFLQKTFPTSRFNFLNYNFWLTWNMSYTPHRGLKNVKINSYGHDTDSCENLSLIQQSELKVQHSWLSHTTKYKMIRFAKIEEAT